MVRPHSTLRTLAALVLLAAAAMVLASLGRWQLQRGSERRTIAAAIEAGREASPLVLNAEIEASALTPWRSAQASGRWLTDKTVLIDNRNHEGRPGYWVATPLLLEASRANALSAGAKGGHALAPRSTGQATGMPAEAGPAVLVLRGWLPRVLGGNARPAAAPPPEGIQHVRGELAQRVPRLFELGGGQYSVLPTSWPKAGPAPLVQNLALDDYARATGLSLMPVVLQQLQSSDDGLVHQWPQPSIDYNQNRGYALQWFAFAAIAAGAFLVVMVRALRRRRQDA
ncbi:MAG: SURF1 family protein [Burkholderiaceae bacterium]|nr:SURF1 family protein [Burkholderiaceae bacterium]